MADEKPAPDAAGKKGKLKTILLLVVVIIVAIGLSVAGTLWFLKDSGTSTPESGATAEPDFQADQYLEIQQALVAAVRAEDKQRFAQAYVALVSDRAEALAAAEKHLPLVRNQLITAISESEFSELRTPPGRAALLERMLEDINAVLAEEGELPVRQVLFRNFVMQ